MKLQIITVSSEISTPLKDAGKHQAREQKARDVGLKGHGSSNSNAGQNNATTGGLARITK